MTGCKILEPLMKFNQFKMRGVYCKRGACFHKDYIVKIITVLHVKKTCVKMSTGTFTQVSFLSFYKKNREFHAHLLYGIIIVQMLHEFFSL
jgi:hypothetical protein